MGRTTGRTETNTRSLHLWRPWTGTAHKRERTVSYKPYEKTDKYTKRDRTSHPVKLFWPKSKCYDYLYQDAETLLRNYPIQATICFYEDSSSDDDSDSEDEKDFN
ncbi:hypothetical protein COCON_G00009500 [Conger conger]|uniref:Protein ripply2 n=1 Tax=Conger conger TaxID=82655 RepID=A0A9Q1E266_CONCO|nr:hypothetical protein COCON_G00009500 [Conger conger]